MNYLAGSVNSPIPIPENYPRDIVSGKGPYVIDKNGSKYIDLWMGYGSLLFGHADQMITNSIRASIEDGWFFSYQTSIEKELAEIIHDIIPSAEKIRFATTGSDAVAYGIRASRSYTGRSRVLSIYGGYHGVHEGMIPSAGTLAKSADLVPFNDVDSVNEKLKSNEYASFILEPVLANAGCTPPQEHYLREIREICSETGTVLIFDEVVTGFRMGISGAQGFYGVTPDISLFSKAIAGGLPLSVVCGKKQIMEQFIPNGGVFFAGTFNAHPLSLSVAKMVISKLKSSDIYKKNEVIGDKLRAFIQEQIDVYGMPACVQGVSSMLTLAFGCNGFKKGIALEKYDAKFYNSFIKKMAKRRILLPPLPTETIFLSPVHEAVLEDIMLAITQSFRELSQEAQGVVTS